MRKYIFNVRFVVGVIFVMLLCDLFVVSSSPAYRYYKQQSQKLDERLNRWENTFKKDYISSINAVASAIASNSVTRNVSSGFSSPRQDLPILKPLDMARSDYAYFKINGVEGFSLGGTLVFRVGDMFLGRQVVSADRFGASLSDGGLIRVAERGFSNPTQKESSVNAH